MLGKLENNKSLQGLCHFWRSGKVHWHIFSTFHLWHNQTEYCPINTLFFFNAKIRKSWEGDLRQKWKSGKKERKEKDREGKQGAYLSYRNRWTTSNENFKVKIPRVKFWFQLRKMSGLLFALAQMKVLGLSFETEINNLYCAY